MKTKNYKCPDCNKAIETRIPTKALVSEKGFWDSLVECPHCKKLHFKKVWPNGKIEVLIIRQKKAAA